MKRAAQITLKDGLMFPSGFTVPASYTCIIFCRVPPEWLDGDRLNMAKLEAVFEKLYGRGWRAGNDDGSRYVVLNAEARILNDTDEQSAPWLGASNDSTHRYWFYDASATGEVHELKPAEFQLAHLHC